MDGYADAAQHVVCMRVADMPQPRDPASTQAVCSTCYQTCWRSPESVRGALAKVPTICYRCAVDNAISGDRGLPYEQRKTEL